MFFGFPSVFRAGCNSLRLRVPLFFLYRVIGIYILKLFFQVVGQVFDRQPQAPDPAALDAQAAHWHQAPRPTLSAAEQKSKLGASSGTTRHGATNAVHKRNWEGCARAIQNPEVSDRDVDAALAQFLSASISGVEYGEGR